MYIKRYKMNDSKTIVSDSGPTNNDHDKEEDGDQVMNFALTKTTGTTTSHGTGNGSDVSLLSRRKEQTTPKALPVAVTLRNLFLPLAGTTRTSSSHNSYTTPCSTLDHDDRGKETYSHSNTMAPMAFSSTVVSRRIKRIQMDIVVPYSVFMELELICLKCPAFQKRLSNCWIKFEKRNVGTHSPIATATTATATAGNKEREDNVHNEFVTLCTAISQREEEEEDSIAPLQSPQYSEKSLGGGQQKKKQLGLPFACKRLVGTDSHPLWDHMGDCLEDVYDYLMGPHGTLCSCHGDCDKNDDRSDIMDSIWDKILSCAMIQCFAMGFEGVGNDSCGDNNHDAKKNLLAMSSLHYHDMIPLPLVSTDSSSSSNILLGVSKYVNAIPHSLPRNSILVHYSDGTTRVSPALYECLVENGVIQHGDVLDGTLGLSMTSTGWGKYEKRFEDNVFEVLQDGIDNGGGGGGGGDNVDEGGLNRESVVKSSSSSSSRSSSVASLVSLGFRKTDNVTLEMKRTKAPCIKMNWKENGNALAMIGHAHFSSSPGRKASNGKAVRGSFAEAFQSLSTDRRVSNGSGMDGKDDSMLASMEWGEDTGSNVGDDIEDRIDEGHNCTENHETNVIRRIQQLEEEIQKLEEILILEESALKKQQQKQQMDVNKLKEFIAAIERIDDESKEIEKEAMDTENECILQETLIGMKRRELLEDLEKIFPIRTGDVFTICGIPIPKNMHSLSASDEVISAGLGFVCLVVIMCSKYLSIPLCYRLIFNSSRSAVREDFEVYPLFKERVVEKEQFDRGIILLNRNIDHLLGMQGVTLTKDIDTMHILSKVDLLLRHIGS